MKLRVISWAEDERLAKAMKDLYEKKKKEKAMLSAKLKKKEVAWWLMPIHDSCTPQSTSEQKSLPWIQSWVPKHPQTASLPLSHEVSCQGFLGPQAKTTKHQLHQKLEPTRYFLHNFEHKWSLNTLFHSLYLKAQSLFLCNSQELVKIFCMPL